LKGIYEKKYEGHKGNNKDKKQQWFDY